MNKKGDKKSFRNEDFVLKVGSNVSPRVWDEFRFDSFVDTLCGSRQYQKDAIFTCLRYLLGGNYQDLRALAKENYENNLELQERYGSWRNMERHLQLPEKLACTIDQATGTGKSYILYGLAAILLAEGVVDKVLVLCPSTTIEDGLLRKFKELASSDELRDAMPGDAVFSVPHVASASESIVAGTICVENYHAILEATKSSIRSSFIGVGERVAVLNDEAHHIANESGASVKRWKEFLLDDKYNFKFIVGVSGTCYINDDYFTDVVHRYSLRQAIEEHFVKSVEYIQELPAEAEGPGEKWQMIYNRHTAWVKKLKPRKIRPLTIIVTQNIQAAEQVTDELIEFLSEHEGRPIDEVESRVLCVTSAKKHQKNLADLRLVDSPASKTEWIVSVSMLSEGWDVKNVFQIVPHEERAFNSKLLIAQVLGRGLRRPEEWRGEDPVVSVFNHDSWSGRIKHLVNEVLEIDRRLTSTVVANSPFHFELHNLDYTRSEDTTSYAKKGEYKLFEEGFVDLPTQVEQEEVAVNFERAVSGDVVTFRTTINHKVWTVDEVAEEMHRRLKSIDLESAEATDPTDRTSYASRFPLMRCREVVEKSLYRLNCESGLVTDENRQRFLQALGTLRRKEAKRVVYKLSPNALKTLSTSSRPQESSSAAEIRRGNKSIFYTPETRMNVAEEQLEFFDELRDPDGEFRGSLQEIPNCEDFRSPVNLVIADATPERKFVRALTTRDNSRVIDAWLKNTNTGFYWIEYAWKKGTAAKRGEFSPDFFILQGDLIFVVEVKGDEELKDPPIESVKKMEYATEHFVQLNRWLAGTGLSIQYQLNFLTPKSFNAFFQKLREAQAKGFRSELDVVLTKSLKTAE